MRAAQSIIKRPLLTEKSALCQALQVSGDGNWVLGQALLQRDINAHDPQPLLWSRDAGIRALDVPGGAAAHVTGINRNGSVVVGWLQFEGVARFRARTRSSA